MEDICGTLFPRSFFVTLKGGEEGGSMLRRPCHLSQTHVEKKDCMGRGAGPLKRSLYEGSTYFFVVYLNLV